MKQVIIEKKIELDHSFERIEQLSCKKQANTVATSEGLQCTGTIEITGIGYLEQHAVPLHESIDLSIFAPFSKLSDTEQFEVQLENYDLKLEQINPLSKTCELELSIFIQFFFTSESSI